MIEIAARELDVLRVFLAQPELHDYEIGQFLGMGESTVKRYTRRLRHKFGAWNRHHLVAICERSA